jgi:type IX secretion system PorP/SprF family membrane protein
MNHRSKYIKSKAIVLLFLVVNCLQLQAQNESYLIHISNHFNLINPAYINESDEYFFKSSYKKFWSNVPEGPENIAISFGLPVGNNLAIGASVVRDKIFFESDTYAGVDLAYNMQLDRFSNLSVGIKVGGSSFSIDPSLLNTYNNSNDPTLVSVNRFNPNAGFGILYTRNLFHFSLAIPKLITTNRSAFDDAKANTIGDSPYLYVSTGYNFYLDEQQLFLFKPSVFSRVQKEFKTNFDFNAMINYNDQFDFGFLYRTTSLIAFKVVARVNSFLYLGYSNELGTSQLTNANNSSEFFLQLKF